MADPEATDTLPAWVFPGQGSQKVGMGRAWAERHPEARAAFEEADDRLGFALSTLCWEGPEEELRRTANTQPALLATSVAILRVLEAAGARPAAAAGHSLGEYSALVAAGALDYGDALALVRRRGELMQEAVPEGEGAMAAILGLDAAAVQEVAAEAAGGQICAVANFNAPGQTVIAGHAPAVERAIALAGARGAKKVVRLPVSAPFHCALMRPAREAMAELLAGTRFEDPAFPVVVNADAVAVTTGDPARDALVRQIDSPVRWVESIDRMVRELGIHSFIEVGPGKVLCALIRRIAPGSVQASLDEPDALAELLDRHSPTLDGD
jgi:[acyl-carrier-protein] S-malonyltransferase